MDTVRHFIAIILIVGLPPGVSFWLLVHPLVRLWRRLGTAWAYSIIALSELALAGLLFIERDALLGQDLGTSWPAIGLGAVLYAAAVWLSLLCRRQLRTSVFAGLPELAPAKHLGRLLHEGVYATIRHPRYAAVILGTMGLALAVNYAGAYVVVGLSLSLLWPVIILEERELAARFGDEYEAYRRRTPVLVPRWPRRHQR